jgi:hypothetical protein
MTLVGIAYAVKSSRQDHRDPGAEFAGLGTFFATVFAIAGGVLLLTFLAALLIRALRQ